MAFSGFLIKVGGSNGTAIPFKYMKAESYKAAPSQRLETEAKRAVTGLLYRTTVDHTATKIEFETPTINNKDLQDLLTLFRNNFTIGIERKLTIYYYNEENDNYETADVYMPDIDYEINHIDLPNNLIYYNPIRICFIEY